MLIVLGEHTNPLKADVWILSESPQEWGIMRKAARVLRQTFNKELCGGTSSWGIFHTEGPKGMRWAGRMRIPNVGVADTFRSACNVVEVDWQPGNAKDPTREQMMVVVQKVRDACTMLERFTLTHETNLKYFHDKEIAATKLACWQGMKSFLAVCNDMEHAKVGVAEQIRSVEEWYERMYGRNQ